MIRLPSESSVIVKFSGNGAVLICTAGSRGKPGHECSDGVPTILKMVPAISLSLRHWKSGSPRCIHSAKMQPKDQRSTAVP